MSEDRAPYLTIRDATGSDWQGIWSFLRPIVRSGETYTWDPHVTEDEARTLWLMPPPYREFVAVDAGGTIVGTAKLGPNLGGPGAHIANASFMVDPAHAGAGIGRALGEHVLLDATFLSAVDRDAARQLATRQGAEFWILECRCADAEIRRRIEARQAQGDASDAGIAVYEDQLRAYGPTLPQEPGAAEHRSHVIVDTGTPLSEAATSVVSSGGSDVGPWIATRWSRCRSSALREFGIIPTKTSPSLSSSSVPLMRGDPYRRTVAIVMCF